jgi:hypothetical protein
MINSFDFVIVAINVRYQLSYVCITTPNCLYLGGQRFSWRSKLNRQVKCYFLAGLKNSQRNAISRQNFHFEIAEAGFEHY